VWEDGGWGSELCRREGFGGVLCIGLKKGDLKEAGCMGFNHWMKVEARVRTSW
jgi:hypothetical protein